MGIGRWVGKWGGANLRGRGDEDTLPLIGRRQRKEEELHNQDKNKIPSNTDNFKKGREKQCKVK